MKTLLQNGCIYDGTGADVLAGDIKDRFHLGWTRNPHTMFDSSEIDYVASCKQARARYMYE